MRIVMLAALGVLGCAASVMATDQVLVSQLEAGHLAEIHTGAVSDEIVLTTQGTESVYVVHTRRADQRYRVHVHARHGRLLSIARRNGDAYDLIYQWPGVRVVAHRGGALLGPPENTIPAIEKAIEIGADLIEIDIRQTRDGHLVLMHDQTVDRTTDGTGRVDQLTLDQIQHLRVRHEGKETIRVPTLREALRAMLGKIDPDLDFKEGNPEPLVTIVRELDLAAHSTMYGSWDRCSDIAFLEPKIRIRPSTNYPLQVPELLHEVRPAIVNMDWHTVTEETVRLSHLGGCHAFVNCLEIADTEFCIGQAIDIGADYIQSDRPDVVIELLKQRGMRRTRPPGGDSLGTPLRHSRLRYPLR